MEVITSCLSKLLLVRRRHVTINCSLQLSSIFPSFETSFNEVSLRYLVGVKYAESKRTRGEGAIGILPRFSPKIFFFPPFRKRLWFYKLQSQSQFQLFSSDE